jgi:hypothetical protein
MASMAGRISPKTGGRHPVHDVGLHRHHGLAVAAPDQGVAGDDVEAVHQLRQRHVGARGRRPDRLVEQRAGVLRLGAGAAQDDVDKPVALAADPRGHSRADEGDAGGGVGARCPRHAGAPRRRGGA